MTAAGAYPYRFSRCPKCGHRPLPEDQSLPAACPACGVILAKVAPRAAPPTQPRIPRSRPVPAPVAAEDAPRLAARLLQVPERVDAWQWRLRALLLAGFALWGWVLAAQDYRSGEIGRSFLHGPLLIFHEAGHVIFRLFGEWAGVLGGTLAQLLLPAVIAAAFLWKNHDPFGAALGLWLLGVSLLDVAPYMYDALQPQLTLLNGSVGEAGGHDWIYLFESMGLRPRAQFAGAATHLLGVLVLCLSLGWAAWLLVLQRRRIGGQTLREG
ncbi:MAG TPA: hypothetical protein PKB14_18435 [Rubrivivax sp.]|nr:hypothetical protein [Rubrivivax sp.]